MKSAIYIENGLTQFVLTPESKTDESVLADMEQNLRASTNNENTLRMYRGSFYRCAGGWVRNGAENYNPCFNPPADHSLIFVIEKKQPIVAPLTIGGTNGGASGGTIRGTGTGFQLNCMDCCSLGSVCAQHHVSQP
jgi:hypothetical protein